MRPLTDEKPKPLVEVCGKPLLDHIVEALPNTVTELVMVVGYKADMIRDYCGDEFHGRSVVYCEQADFAGGTGDALMCTKDAVTDTFLFMYADDIHGAAAIEEAIKHPHAIMEAKSDHPQDYGVLVKNPDGTMKGIMEKPEKPETDMIYIGGCVLSPDIFEMEAAVCEERGECLVTDMLTKYAERHPVRIVRQDTWISVGSPEDVQKAEAILCP